MQVAQRLYEGMDVGGETAGLITYMRTDGVQMAPEALAEARKAIVGEFGEKYLPEKPRYYSAKAKNAQEAHEAIRPTDFSRTPTAMRKYLDADQARLYEMIWKRAIASQMQPAEIERTTVEIEATNGGRIAGLRAVGSVVRFDGFIAAYTEQRDEDSEDEENKRLPEIRAGEALQRDAILATQHTTEPPPRYSEATLIKKLEELGIGRPSTYTAILKTLEDREYVTIDKRRLVPHSKGRLLTGFLENFFEKYVEYDFTASLEEKLDEISDGKLAWKDVLRDFWKDFSASVDDIKELRVTDVLDALNEELAPLVFPAREDGSNPRICPKCGTGNLSLKLGKYGAFVPNAAIRASSARRPMARARASKAKTAPGRSARTPTRPKRSRCAAAASAPISSAAKARRPSAQACPRDGRRIPSTTRRRWRCFPCRATSASIPKAAR
jgi:DNA topoisomerase-1